MHRNNRSANFYVWLGAALIGALLSHVLRFENSVTIESDGRVVRAQAHRTRLEAPFPGLAPERVEVVLQKSMAGRMALAGFELQRPGAAEERHAPFFFYFFGQPIPAPRYDPPVPSFKRSLGDWEIDRFYSAPVSIVEQALHGPFSLTVRFVGRGTQSIRLVGSKPLIVTLRDGFIDNDFSICEPERCLASSSSVEAPLTNLSRMAGLAANVASVAGLLIALSALFGRRRRPAPARAASPPLGRAACLLAGIFFAGCLWFQTAVLGGIPHVPDSAAYYRQAVLLSHGKLSARLPPVPVPDALLPHAAYLSSAGDLHVSHATHFWPALLAIFIKAGVPEILTPLLVTIILLLTYLLARRLYDEKTALVAGLLWAAFPFAVIQGGDYMPHAAAAVFLLGGALVAAAHARQGGWRWGLLMGFLWAYAFAIRPWTTCLFVLPFAAAALLRNRPSLRFTAASAAGALPVFVLLLFDNHFVTGSFFATPYTARHHLSLSLLNFPDGVNWMDSTLGFLPALLWHAPLALLPLALALIGLILGRRPVDLLMIAPFLMLIIGHTFINAHGLHGYGPRFLFEGLFGIALLGARGVLLLGERLPRAPRPALYTLGALLMALNLCNTAALLPAYSSYNGISPALYRTLRRLDLSRSVVVVSDPAWQGTEIGAALFDPGFAASMFLKELPDGGHFKNLTYFAEREAYRIAGGEVAPFEWENLPQGRQALRESALAAALADHDSAVSAESARECSAGRPSGFVQLWWVLAWLLTLGLATAAALPLFQRLGVAFPDRGWGFAKVFGLLLLFYGTWLLQALQLLQANARALWAVLGALLVISLRWQVPLWRGAARLLCGSELVFLAAFALFLFIRSLQPEIFWGEKPMHFSFLNYFARIDAMPPHDPWAAGETLRYYYLGSYIFGSLIRMIGIDPAVGYNLAMATVPALLFSALWSLFLALSRSRLFASLAAAFVVLASNLEWLNLLGSAAQGFDFFWATTRLFDGRHWFVEYPSWSFLFGDLHAHVVALPFAALFVGLLVLLVFQSAANPPRHSPAVRVLRLLCPAMVLGALAALNVWDFISSIFIVLIAAAAAAARLPAIVRRRRAAGLQSLLAYPAALLVVGWGVSAPFREFSGLNRTAAWGWVSPSEFNRLPDIFVHTAPFLVTGAAALLLLLTLVARRRRPAFNIGPVLGACAGASASAAPGLVTAAAGSGQAAVGILLATSAISALAGAAVAIFRQQRVILTGAALVIAACFLINMAEAVYLMDRMNTIFKTYNAVWLAGSTGAALLCWGILEQIRWPQLRMRARIVVGCALAAPAIVIGLALTGGIINIATIITFQRVDGPRPSLDGSAYLCRTSPDEGRLVTWINRNIRGTPPLLEAFGQSYGAYSRLTMHTGLPTVLGWEYHVLQRGVSAAELAQRKRDIARAYSAGDPLALRQILQHYNVRYLLLGALEAATYGARAEQFEHTLHKVFESGQTRLYELLPGGVKSGFANPPGVP